MKVEISIAILLMASVVMAKVDVVTVGPEDVSEFVYQERALSKLDIDLPSDVTAESFLSASITLGVDASEFEGGLAEVEIAALSGNAPIVPSGKSVPVSTLIADSEASSIVLDISPIIRDILSGSSSSFALVAGPISSDTIGDCNPIALDADAGVWAIVEFNRQVLRDQ